MFKLLFRLGGWKITHYLPKDIKRCVIVAAPHTSNWDFMYGMGALKIMKLRLRFTIKKEWIRFPLKKLMLTLGALPIDRSPKSDGSRKSSVEAMAELFDTRDELLLMITPEGTRSRVEKWRTGFYYVALSAKVPLALGFMDYRTRECGIDKILYPSGDFERDMKEIMAFYATKTAKNPHQFSVDRSFEI